MLVGKKKYTIHNQQGVKASRFMVDLKKTRAQNINNNHLKPKQESKKTSRDTIFLKKIKENFHRLAFFYFFKLVANIFYSTGWLTLFLLRFFYFFTLSFLILLKKLVNVEKFKFSLKKIKHTKKPKSGHYSMEDVFKIEREKFSIKKEIGIFANKIKPKFGLTMLKPVISMAIIFIILALPFKAFLFYGEMNDLKGRVLGASVSAIDEMKEAVNVGKKLDFSTADDKFSSSLSNFIKAEKDIEKIDSLIDIFSKVIPVKDIKLASQADIFLNIGTITARIGGNINQVAKQFQENDIDFKKVVDLAYSKLEESRDDVDKLTLLINEIDVSVLPGKYQDDFNLLKNGIKTMPAAFNEILELVKVLRGVLGFDYDRRYLVVFQNNTEMRGSGGFIGSYALVDFHNGKIKNLEIPTGGSYDTEAGLRVQVVSPKPLQLVNPLWHFWDANWWPDWEKSAKKLMWFYEKSDGPTVDGVIALTPNVIESFLHVVGSVDMTEEYGKIINAENFWSIVQDVVEEKEENVQLGTSTLVALEKQKHEPKKIIKDIALKILDKISKINKKDAIKIFQELYSNLNKKHILIYLSDESKYDVLKKYNWTGSIQKTDGDYLMVVNSNIAGQKTDKRIKENISLLRKVEGDGSIVNTLKIQRIHSAIRGDEYIGVRNVDWLRVYVPLGSELLSANGFNSPDKSFFENPDPNWVIDEDIAKSEGRAIVDKESSTKIYNESGKTVFANWSMIDPGEQAVLTIKYRLPFKVKKEGGDKNKIVKLINYQESYTPLTLLVQKQPGSQGSIFVSNLVLPNNMSIIWQNNNDPAFKKRLSTDQNWSVLLKIQKNSSGF